MNEMLLLGFSILSTTFGSNFSLAKLEFIDSSILLISDLWDLTVCKIWSRYLDVIQSLINGVVTDNNI